VHTSHDHRIKAPTRGQQHGFIRVELAAGDTWLFCSQALDPC